MRSATLAAPRTGSLGLHCRAALRAAGPKHDRHGPCSVAESSASARAPPSHRCPTLPLPGRRGRGRLEPRVASSVAAVSTAMSVAQHMCWRELGADGRRDDGVRREDPVQASEDDRLHLLAARLMHLWCGLRVPGWHRMRLPAGLDVARLKRAARSREVASAGWWLVGVVRGSGALGHG